MPRIFISYARKHVDFARRLATSLSNAGAIIWIDVDDIPAGMKWSTAIQQGLNLCEVMLVIITPESMVSVNVEDEWQFYFDKHKLVMPILLEPAEVHFQLNRLQYVDFYKQDYNTAFKQLHSELRRKGIPLIPISAYDTNVPIPVQTPLPLRSNSRLKWLWMAGGGLTLTIVIVIGLIVSSNNPIRSTISPSNTPSLTTGVIVQNSTDVSTLTSTPTATDEPTRTQQSQTPAPSSLDAALQLARAAVTRNADWQPFEAEFNGVKMMLVPAGCFDMGSEAYDNEQPVHEQCFDAPFWIDRTEVTRAMYAECMVAALDKCTETPPSDYSTWYTQPINNVTWFQARDYCEWRGGRLPTEREWEYAARGPDALKYPWGSDWDETKVVWNTSSTADVGSLDAGRSWAGALDLSGNVWEWVNTIYDQDHFHYPYEADGGRESSDDVNSARVLRGGSWDSLAPDYLRAAVRNSGNPNYGNILVSFRCVLS
jgi:formylglycine-generating enzyme required for sulfatase activity